MKCSTTSFLFLCILFLGSLSIFGQQAVDSVQYYRDLIVKPDNTDQLISGSIFFRNNKDKRLRQKDSLGAIHDILLIVIAEIKLGENYLAENTIVEGLELLDQRNRDKDRTDMDYRNRLYNELGIVYRNQKNYKRALEVYDKILAMHNPKIDSLRIITNKGNIFKDQGEWLLAQKEYSIVYNERKEDTNQTEIANALNNLGWIEGKLDNPGGINKMLEALDLRISANDASGSFSSYDHLANYYKDRGEVPRAKEYALEAYKLSKSLGKEYRLKVLSTLTEISEDRFAVEFVHLTDSLSYEAAITENKYAAAKYDVGKEKEKTLESELKREEERRQKLMYQAIGAFVLLASIFLYFILRVRHKKSKTEQIYKTETRISKKVHDEVANDIYYVMTRLQNSKHVDERILDELEAIYAKTRDISKENNIINSKDNFTETLKFLLLNYKTTEIEVITRGISSIQWKQVSENKKTALYRVLQELMTNMKKHSNASLVAITFEQSNKKIKVAYKDNGVGTNLVKASGLLNTENRIASVNGTISFESKENEGFKAIISL